MKIPSKITPDRIRDSIVQVFFKAYIPFEPLIGFCYAALDKSGWKYTNRQPLSGPQQGLVIEVPPSSQHFFVKDHVRLQLFPNQSLAFNCINNYIGWQAYGNYIQSVINDLVATGNFIQFSRIGIRYISEFANIDILDKIKLEVSPPPVSGQVVNSSYRFAFEEKGVTKSIQIASKLPVNALLRKPEDKVEFVSILDVDVVKKGLTIKDAGELWDEIDNVHTIEKKTFFGLLCGDFLQSLNPEYT